jgi:hypothetical protein
LVSGQIRIANSGKHIANRVVRRHRFSLDQPPPVATVLKY